MKTFHLAFDESFGDGKMLTALLPLIRSRNYFVYLVGCGVIYKTEARCCIFLMISMRYHYHVQGRIAIRETIMGLLTEYNWFVSIFHHCLTYGAYFAGMSVLQVCSVAWKTWSQFSWRWRWLMASVPLFELWNLVNWSYYSRWVTDFLPWGVSLRIPRVYFFVPSRVLNAWNILLPTSVFPRTSPNASYKARHL